MRTLIFFAWLVLAVPRCSPAQSSLPEPTIVPAVDGVLDAFTTHPIVAIGDLHGLAQEEDFYANIVRSPRFAAEVGNVVVEFGDAAQQQTLDRYLAGEEVPYQELRRVWADTVGWLPFVLSLGYENFYAQVREVNRKLKPEQQIHVWLGDPAIDWSVVKTAADLPKDSRDQVPAELLKKLVGMHKKALLIYGTSHFFGPDSIRSQVEQRYPKSIYLIHLYSGFQEELCSSAFEKLTQGTGEKTLISPVQGTTLVDRLKKPGCHVLPPNSAIFPANYTAEQKTRAMEATEDQQSGIDADALLYLGPARTLTMSQETPDLYMDIAFRKEIVRRAEIMLRRSLTDTPVNVVPVSPRFFRSYGGNLPN